MPDRATAAICAILRTPNDLPGSGRGADGDTASAKVARQLSTVSCVSESRGRERGIESLGCDMSGCERSDLALVG
jgi:hypothetical protein